MLLQCLPVLVVELAGVLLGLLGDPELLGDGPVLRRVPDGGGGLRFVGEVAFGGTRTRGDRCVEPDVDGAGLLLRRGEVLLEAALEVLGSQPRVALVLLDKRGAGGETLRERLAGGLLTCGLLGHRGASAS